MSETKREIAGLLRGVADALRSGASAAEFAGMLYAPEVVVAGEGWPRAIRGIGAFLPELTGLLEAWGPRPDLTFRIVDPVIAGEGSATTLVDVQVEPSGAMAGPENYRVMYAWIRTADGWRVAAEMYTSGSF
jgi:ketosteroid isomerase-like protein